MHDVAIIGAGELGGNLAHLLARRDVVRAIRLIDDAGRVAAGTALDIMQASPIEQFATTVTGSSDISQASGAAIVVVADRSGRGEWQGDEAALLLKQLSQIARHAVVLGAGALHREPVERAIRERLFAAPRICGSSPEALSAALRSLIALETNGASRDIALTILGVPPDHTVIPWQTVTIAGFAATDLLSEPARRRIEGRLALLWPPGPYALAAAAAEAIAAMVTESQRALSCFVASGESVHRGQRVAALPVKLGAAGIARIELPELDPRARVALDTAMRG